MRGRPTIFNEEQLIEKAQKVFWEKGFNATSLEDLLQAMQIGSGSFYNTFKGGKKEVFSKAVQLRRRGLSDFKKELMQSESPIDLIKDFFRSLAQTDRYTHLLGCLIVNTIIEMTFVDDTFEDEAVSVLKEMEQLYIWAIAKAQQEGKMKNQTSPEILGRYLVTFWSGFNVIRRMYPDNEVLKTQIEMQLSILN
ncbi:TetR/AcrR family transcriptional regulator [Flavobacterium reichenbachii]|uniref:TetR family transcriptional regulator n=1 Tax=Flavobacterium reichenbachii TaxID=362418 RepID=A0A085ZER8_9FLAO|nr:TetR/AcrR family transcriptional regulator [Flavobacterium reichenbachii]KFF02932.1 TetR family transcriptional regulator [Flavobacterium reichenbachii]OXB17000.1 TetR family transcriptional regulator [Flavobacterium reichenbachii]